MGTRWHKPLAAVSVWLLTLRQHSHCFLQVVLSKSCFLHIRACPWVLEDDRFERRHGLHHLRHAPYVGFLDLRVVLLKYTNKHCICSVSDRPTPLPRALKAIDRWQEKLARLATSP